jgi:predicted ATPase
MKILITGTFCSGKTTLAEALREEIKNSIILEEPARELVTYMPNVNWSRSYIRNYLITRQILIEEIAQLRGDYIIVDAGIESNIAHDILFNADFSKEKYLSEFNHKKYDYVFFCQHEEITFINDGYRLDDVTLREKLAITIKETLLSLGYDIIFVNGNVQNRVKQVLTHIAFL